MRITRFKKKYLYLLLIQLCVSCISFKYNGPNTKDIINNQDLKDANLTLNYNEDNIYKIGNIYHYSVKQTDSNRALNFKVIMEILPGNINNGQLKLKYVYKYDIKDLTDKDFREGFPVKNKKEFLEYSGDSIVTMVEGFIENKEKIWFHPMRIFTLYDLEYTPFPKMRLRTGKSLLSVTNLYIPDSYYPNGVMKMKYESPVIEYLTADSSIYVARINSQSKFKKKLKDSPEHKRIKEGVACNSYFLFHSEDGFTEMNHEFANGNLVKIVLDSITLKTPL